VFSYLDGRTAVEQVEPLFSDARVEKRSDQGTPAGRYPVLVMAIISLVAGLVLLLLPRFGTTADFRSMTPV
jgi:hypothetical protein